MTEEEWLSSQNAGVMVQFAKRAFHLPPKVMGRKFRLAAVALFRDVPAWETNPHAGELVAAVEDYCDLGGPFSTLTRLRDRLYPLFSTSEKPVPLLTTLADGLLNSDAFECAYTCASRRSINLSAIGLPKDRDGALLRDIFGNPFRPVKFDLAWRTEHAVGLSAKMYEDRDFRAMPILADALEEAGCDSADILTHCREPGVHVRGCWVVDQVLGKA